MAFETKLFLCNFLDSGLIGLFGGGLNVMLNHECCAVTRIFHVFHLLLVCHLTLSWAHLVQLDTGSLGDIAPDGGFLLHQQGKL